MKTRKIIRKIHLWIGLPAGLILAVVGLTGSIYIFQPEITSWLNQEKLLPAKEEVIFSSDKEIARYIEDKTGKKIKSLQWPLRERRIYMFMSKGDDNSWYYLDQTTGEISPRSELTGSAFFAFVKELHTNLIVGEPGRWITATASLLLAIIMIGTGLYLWWPRNWKILKTWRGFKSRFTININRSKKRLNYDLHSVLGFYMIIPLFLMSITGAYFIYDNEIQWVVDTITLSEERSNSDWTKKVRAKAPEDKEPLTIYDALDIMDELYPQYLKRNMWMYTLEERGYLSLAFQETNTVSAGPQFRIFVSVDPYTGEILRDTNPNNLPMGSRISELWLLPVHFGEFGGLITRIIWFAGGLMPTLFLITGFIMWKNRGTNKSLQNLKKKVIIRKRAYLAEHQ